MYARYGKQRAGIAGEAMVAARRVITLSIRPDQCCALANIAHSRTEATGQVKRARIILAYLDTPSARGVARQIGVSQQTVMRCLERAGELGAWPRWMADHQQDVR
jgi:hypothetical protein